MIGCLFSACLEVKVSKSNTSKRNLTHCGWQISTFLLAHFPISPFSFPCKVTFKNIGSPLTKGLFKLCLQQEDVFLVQFLLLWIKPYREWSTKKDTSHKIYPFLPKQESLLNPLQPGVAYLYPLKTLENHWHGIDLLNANFKYQ